MLLSCSEHCATVLCVVAGEGRVEGHPTEGDPQSPGVQTEVSELPASRPHSKCPCCNISAVCRAVS